ncbi:hypothetical protein AAG570_002589 [Ranatra chinensis]|uniref:Hemocyanin middle domain-containing protein n=1 Tax=Ranatra chinensis TaxID=642074 RepID=A0ABD0Y8E4_9HEMI
MAPKHRNMFYVASWLSGQMNYEQFVYSIAIVLTHRSDLHVVLPPWYIVFPNYFVPAEVMDFIKRGVENGMSTNVPFWGESNNGPYYFNDDPSVSNMYFNWVLQFPQWMDPEKYGVPEWRERGGHFYRYHHQLLSAFYFAARSTSNQPQLVMSRLQDWDALESDKSSTKNSNPFTPNLKLTPIPEYLPYLPSLKPAKPTRKTLASRSPLGAVSLLPILTIGECHQWLKSTFSLVDSRKEPIEERSNITAYDEPEELKDIEQKLWDVVAQNTIILSASSMVDVNEFGDLAYSKMSSLVFNLTDSLNSDFYGNYYESLVNFLAETGLDNHQDGESALAGYPLTRLKDPSYYTVLAKATSPILDLIKAHPSPIMMPIAGLAIRSIEVDDVETELRQFRIDLGPYFGRPRGKFTADQAVLDHSPVVIRLTLENNSTDVKEAVVTVFLPSPHRMLDLEIDRFLVAVPPGSHTFERDIKDSSVLANEDKTTFQCGIPERLALPMGRPEGLIVDVAAVIEPRVEWEAPASSAERYIRKTALCGCRRYENGGRPPPGRGWPLDVAVLYGLAAKAEMKVFHRVEELSWRFGA